MDHSLNPEIAGMFAEGVKPPDRRPPWQWAEEHVTSIPYSPMPGRFRSDNSPWVREVMEAMVDPRVKVVSIIASVQSSKTTAPELTLSYIISNLPGPTLWLDQTDEDAKDQSESRLQKLFEECEPVKNLYPKDRHKRRNHTIHFANGMTLWILGAHNKTNLQRRSIRWLIGDETWRWPTGHMAEAEARVTAFGWLGKCIFMSQGGEEDDDTHRKFETTDMREWTFQCPHCGKRQPFDWDNVEWSKSARTAEGDWDFTEVRKTTSLRCCECNHYFADSDATRRQLNATGKFVRTNPKASEENVGFHWNALCAMSWGKLAEMYLRAKAAARQGDTSLLQQFYQKRLALPWREYVEDFKADITRSNYCMGDPWPDEGYLTAKGTVVDSPTDGATVVPLRFLSVDVQMDHFWLVVRAWSASGSSRLMWCERALTWEDVERVQERFGVHGSLVFVDAGYNSYEVYRHCARKGWTALMGDNRPTFTHKVGKQRVQRFYSPVRKVYVANGQVCRMHYWSNLNMKDSLARLRRNLEGGPTWEIPEDIPEEYLLHMDSEHRIKRGGKWFWDQIGKRPNHMFDAECEQVVGAHMLKIIGRESVPQSGESDPEG
ncbi:MAG: terminase gpA endonuclease subunit [Puniceicoccaceae bacterium]